MRKWITLLLAILVIAFITVVPVQAASPFASPPGLERAIAAQEAHTDQLLNIPGVIGTAVGLESGRAVVEILTERPGVAGLPGSLDSVPVAVQVTGKIIALGKGGSGNKGKGGSGPTASFTYTYDNSDPYTVAFDASSSSGPHLSYAWAFGDSQTASGVTVNHSYQPGTYTVTLTVTDKFGGTNSDTQEITVPFSSGNNQPPVASFTYSTSGLNCTFDASGSSDPDGTITAYNWNFGDGNTGSNSIITHNYASFDTYTVQLTVTDNEGATDTISEPVTVSEVVDPTSYFSRPVPIGVSSGSERLSYYQGSWYYTTGTLGVRVKKGSEVYALSNNHVYALENNGVVGDRILQPGRVDMVNGGTSEQINNDTIGTLSNFVPIQFRIWANNTVDAAIAITDGGEVGKTTPSDGYGIPSSTTASAALNMAVQKYGRTTSLTRGTVTGINATVLVSYWSGTARFVNQVLIQGNGGSFSDSGDSGSLIVTQDGNHPVALLFAGSSTVTIGNPINDVLNAFGVTIDGN